MHHKELSYICHYFLIFRIQMRNLYFLSVLFLTMFLAFSCTTNQKHKPVKQIDMEQISPSNKSFDIKIKYAQGFSVEHKSNYDRLTVHNPWDKSKNLGVYILVHKSFADSVHLEKGEMLISLPLKKIAIMSSSNVGYFDLLNNLNLIKAISDANRLYNPYLRAHVKEGGVTVLGSSTAINTETLLACNCDVFLQTAYGAFSSSDQSLIEKGVPLVYNIDWMEKTPLARAEWIKFIGLLSEENERADSVFSTIEQNYFDLKQKADSLSYKPDVLIGSLFKDVWYMPGGESYKAILLNDAGARYHWSTDSTQGSLALSFETVLDQQMNAAVWVDVPFKTKHDLLSSDERYAYFDAFKIGSMYHNLKRQNASGGNDYWEMGLCRPDELLLDLFCIFHPEYAPERELKYYERVSSN